MLLTLFVKGTYLNIKSIYNIISKIFGGLWLQQELIKYYVDTEQRS